MTTVGFTRPSDRLEESKELCRQMGLGCICAPSLEPIHGTEKTFGLVKRILSEEDAYFIVFASTTAVDECVREFGKDALKEYLEHTNVACTGKKTAEHLESTVGRECDLIPETYSGECIAQDIADEVGDKLVLILRSDSPGSRMEDILKEAGAYVVDAPVYSMVPAPLGPDHTNLMDAVASGKIDAMVFSSPLTARTFLAQMDDRFEKKDSRKYLSDIFKVAMGKPTYEAMKMLECSADAVAGTSTFEGMLQTVKEHFD